MESVVKGAALTQINGADVLSQTSGCIAAITRQAVGNFLVDFDAEQTLSPSDVIFVTPGIDMPVAIAVNRQFAPTQVQILTVTIGANPALVDVPLNIKIAAVDAG